MNRLQSKPKPINSQRKAELQPQPEQFDPERHTLAKVYAFILSIDPNRAAARQKEGQQK